MGFKHSKVAKLVGQESGALRALDAVSKAMHQLAKAFTPKKLSGSAFSLYEKFRPQIAAGKRGWGQKGTLDLELIRSLSRGA